MANIVTCILGVCALEDMRFKSVSLMWIVAFIISALTYTVIGTADLKQIGLGLVIGIIVVIISLVFNVIGMADALLLCGTGIILGFDKNLIMFSCATFISACYSLVLLVFRKKCRKDEIAFVPFIFISYIWMMYKG